MGAAFSIAVQLIAALLFGMGIASFLTLLKGCFVLRRMVRAGRQDHSPVILKSPMAPAVSTIAIPPDASPESVGFARRLLEMHFGRNEVVIVLDGPSESDLAVWNSEFRLCPSPRVVRQTLATARVRGVYESRDPIRVVVIDKEAGGPVDAWNAAVNACTSPVIGLLDPASEFQPEVLLRLIQPMMEAFDETVAICGGVPAPPAAGLAAQFSALESLRIWMTRGAAFAGRGRTLPFPGAAVLVKRASIIQAGGFTGGLLELFVRLHGMGLASGKPYRILFLPEPVSRGRVATITPELRRQVRRNQQELASASGHRVTLAGPFGWEVLRELIYTQVFRPWLEMAAYAMAITGFVLGWVDVFTLLLVLLATAGMGMVLSMAAVVLREFAEPAAPDERRMAAMFFAAIPENLGYWQLRNWWLMWSFRQPRGGRKQAARKAQDRPPAVSTASS